MPTSFHTSDPKVHPKVADAVERLLSLVTIVPRRKLRKWITTMTGPCPLWGIWQQMDPLRIYDGYDGYSAVINLKNDKKLTAAEEGAVRLIILAADRDVTDIEDKMEWSPAYREYTIGIRLALQAIANGRTRKGYLREAVRVR